MEASVDTVLGVVSFVSAINLVKPVQSCLLGVAIL
jgi:hypothetical protein